MEISKTRAQEVFAALDFTSAAKWTPARLAQKLNKLNTSPEAEEAELDDEELQTTLDELLAANEAGDEITVTSGKKTPAKKGKAKPKAKPKAKTPPPVDDEDDDDEDDADDDEDDDIADMDDSDDDSDDDEDDDDTPPPPAKKKGRAKKAAPKAKAKPAAKKTTPKKAPKAKAKNANSTKKPKGTGVIAEIRRLLNKATDKRPISKAKMLELLVKKFADRDGEAMMKTINTQVPSRLNRDREDFDVTKNENGYWNQIEQDDEE
jgi:hypothetical protein